MYQEVSEVERRLSELQAQIDRLSLSLHLWSEKQEQLQPIEQRLSHLAEQCTEIVERWGATGGRHAEAVGEIERRLESWNAAEGRVAQEASTRIRDLQHLIEHEWNTLRQLHEEPVKQLREQATNLAQISVAAASSALNGFERTEARLAALESNFHQRLTELSDQMQSMVAEVRAASRGALPPAPQEETPSWALEDVVRLHSQHREPGDPAPLPAATASADTPEVTGLEKPPPPMLPEAPAALVGRMETLERDLIDEQARLKETERGLLHDRRWRMAIVALIVLVAGAGAIVVGRLQQQLVTAEARAMEAEDLAAESALTAAEQVAAARQEVDRANLAARQAQTVGDVLASPDLVRYNMVGGNGILRGQTIFSRSRGLVFTASRLPPPPAGSTYQIWLLTPTGAHSAGLFVPDAEGRFTLATDQPPTAPPPIVGVSVTVEPEGGRDQPTGPTILARAQ